jgi:signal transduction histidine kinase
MVQRLIERHEEFALAGDFAAGEGKRHLRISGQAIRNVSGEYTYTLLMLDDSVQTELRRAYEYMFRLAQHELKGPLAVITSAAEMAQEQIDAGETASAKSCLAMIERNAQAIEEMITRYLNLSRIESGAIRMTYEPLVFSTDVLDPIVAECQLQLTRRNMHVSFKLVGLDAEPEIIASREGCEIVMRNLISNAIKYGDPGTSIAVTLGQPQDDVLIAVKNKGPNIPEEYLSKLFQRFVRLEATQGTKGSGLGLYNARKLVELWGGTIAVNSGDNETRFTFTIPQPE